MISREKLISKEFYHIEPFPNEFFVGMWNGRWFYYTDLDKRVQVVAYDDVLSISEYTKEVDLND